MGKYLFIICMMISGLLGAQYLDSLHVIFNNKSSIDVRIETKRSLINNVAATVQGVRAGVAFQRKLRLGGGVSWLKTTYFHEENVHYSDNSYLRYYNFLKFVYLCFYADFVFHKTKRWQLSVPIQAGGGLIWYQENALYNFPKQKKHAVFFYEPGITVQFKITRFLGLGTDICYRYALKSKQITERLNSPTISLKVMVWFDQLFYLSFPEHTMTKKRGPAVW